MKKNRLILLASALALLTLVSCKKTDVQTAVTDTGSSVEEKKSKVKSGEGVGYAGTPFNAESYSEEAPEYKERNALHLEMNAQKLVNFDSVKQFFALDYTPEYPDSVFADSAANSKDSKKNKTSANKNETSESHIPGIRKLSDYVTKYMTKKSSLQDYKPTDEAEEDDSTKEFYIEDWGPQDKIVAGENHPTFYVIFSRPARSLQALDKPQTTSDIITINPPLPGVFRWYGTKHLSFESDIPADPTVQYTISIKEGFKSAGGKKLTGETVFHTQAEPVEVINLWGGYIKDSDCAYDWNTGALPPYENRFVMRTNYTTTLSSIKQNLTVTINGQSVECDIQPVYKDIFRMWANHAEYDQEAGRSNTWLVEIKNEVPHGTQVVIVNTNGATDSYYTLMPFGVNEVSQMTEYSSSKYKWPLTVYFSQVPNERSLVENITYDNGKKITEENIVVHGRTVKICNLPFDYNQEHTIKFGNVKDKYDQPLAAAESVYSFKTPEEKAYVRFQNYGTTMLEAQFPHKMIFGHQNLLSGNFSLQKTDRPSGNGLYEFNKNPTNLCFLDLGEKNQRNFQELDLDPYLEDGYGFVRFDAVANYKQYNYWREEYRDEKSTMSGVVQVTDLGLTARMAVNKAVVMVHSLSTGKPVEGAEVYIVHNLNDYQEWRSGAYYPKEIFVYGDESTYDKLYAKGVTDKNGLAVINYSEDEIEKVEHDRNLFVYVVNGKDKAAFAPSSHNSWREGVRTASLEQARKPVQRTFMFVDRGIYKPGETVTFRGIDRDQLLGTFTAHHSNYTINVKGAWWDSKNIIEPITGELSESGGFYGSFKIPENTDRGYYNLVYRRSDATGRYDEEIIRFTIADFERVKFESSITVPEISYFGGDKLTASLSADYLAGGSLGGANYEVSWYKSATTFKTSDPAAKGYSFYTGVYPDRNYYSNDTGALGVDGTASLSCESEKITDGAPYVYHVESAVTDVSNQRIATQNDIFVHPAQFYVGIAKARNLRGFAKSGEKIEIPYILVNPDGKIMGESDVPLKVSELEYSLSHEEWTMVHEQSVDDTIYTRYERKDVEDENGTLKALANGILPVTPKIAGWYTLTITGKDSRGNKVLCKSEFYVTGSGAAWFDQYNSYSLNLTPDKSQYNPGETARVLLESPLPAGDYLITVEREGIFTEEVRHFDNNAEVLEIPVAGNYVPVVYVSVSSYSERHGAPTHEYGSLTLISQRGITELHLC